jgi:hypothetical protein
MSSHATFADHHHAHARLAKRIVKKPEAGSFGQGDAMAKRQARKHSLLDDQTLPLLLQPSRILYSVRYYSPGIDM